MFYFSFRSVALRVFMCFKGKKSVGETYLLNHLQCAL